MTSDQHCTHKDRAADFVDTWQRFKRAECPWCEIEKLSGIVSHQDALIVELRRPHRTYQDDDPSGIKEGTA